MKKLMIALMLSIGIGSVAMAMNGQHGQRLDWDKLNLTANQEEQVQTIRKTYRNEFQSLRKYGIEKAEMKQQMLVLRTNLITSIQNVLTDEQKQQASAQVIEQLEKRMIKRLHLLSGKLALTSDQKQSVEVVLASKLVALKGQLLLFDISNLTHVSKYMIS